MTLSKPQLRALGTVAAFALFVGVSVAANYAPGRGMGRDFARFFLQMLRILPCVFILIGLFDVWVKKETIERHLGPEAGFGSYIWALLLAGTTVGGFHVALPIAHALHVKGARFGVIIAYVSSAAICRVPMTLFEASFLGWKFTAVRFAASLPIVILFSDLLGRYLQRRNYQLPEQAQE